MSVFAQKPVGENWLNIDNVPGEDAIKIGEQSVFPVYALQEFRFVYSSGMEPQGDVIVEADWCGRIDENV